MIGSGDSLAVYWYPWSSLDDFKMDARCDQMRAKIARGITHTDANRHNALDRLDSFGA
jgi:hypothetical protein